MGKQIQPTLQIEHVPLDSLHPDPANPRRIGDAELEALTRSIRQFGLIDPIIARHDDRIVMAPRGRGSVFLEPFTPQGAVPARLRPCTGFPASYPEVRADG